MKCFFVYDDSSLGLNLTHPLQRRPTKSRGPLDKVGKMVTYLSTFFFFFKRVVKNRTPNIVICRWLAWGESSREKFVNTEMWRKCFFPICLLVRYYTRRGKNLAHVCVHWDPLTTCFHNYFHRVGTANFDLTYRKPYTILYWVFDVYIMVRARCPAEDHPHRTFGPETYKNAFRILMKVAGHVRNLTSYIHTYIIYTMQFYIISASLYNEIDFIMTLYACIIYYNNNMYPTLRSLCSSSPRVVYIGILCNVRVH